LLLSSLQATIEQSGSDSDVRVVDLNTAAFSETPPAGLLLSEVKTEMSNIHYMKLYGHSKLAYYYHTKFMARKYTSIKFVAVHPGWVYTNIFEPHFKGRPYIAAAVGFFLNIFLTDVHQGAKGQLWASFGPKEQVRAGGFYKPSGQEFEHPLLDNDKLAQELWDWTEVEFEAKGIPPS
jgi:NAD(P)-dependent dehydrogenase (short-subunit alcohol dehydrogenase family)